MADVRRWEEWRDWAMDGESYDFEELMFLHYRPGAGDVVVDVGAGHGGETFALANMVGPGGSSALDRSGARHLSAAGAAVSAQRLEAGRTDSCGRVGQSGTLTISDGPEWVAVNVFEPGTTEVPAVTLDDLCLERGITRIDWLKMNIEGAEKEAIKGMETIAPMIRNVTISCHDLLGTERANRRAKSPAG